MKGNFKIAFYTFTALTIGSILYYNTGGSAHHNLSWLFDRIFYGFSDCFVTAWMISEWQKDKKNADSK